MSNYVNEKISSLRRLASKGVSASSLDQIIGECSALVSDGHHVLAAYVIRHVCEEINDSLEADIPHADRHSALTNSIADKLSSILETIETNRTNVSPLLEDFISTHLSNLAALRFR